jgi:hypothetical protein
MEKDELVECAEIFNADSAYVLCNTNGYSYMEKKNGTGI